MVSRHWKGIAKNDQAENYINHLKSDTFPKISKIDGFVRASILKRNTTVGTEFLIVTVWESIEAIKSFAGESFENAVVPPIVQEMMIDYDSTVTHYEVLEQFTPR